MGGSCEVSSVVEPDPNHKIRKISTTIKRKWMAPILLGLKTSEYKQFSKHWERLNAFKGDHGTGECMIVYLCGRKVYKYWVTRVSLHSHMKNIDGKDCRPFWEILLQGRACTQASSGVCDYRLVVMNAALQEVPFCSSNEECPVEERGISVSVSSTLYCPNCGNSDDSKCPGDCGHHINPVGDIPPDYAGEYCCWACGYSSVEGEGENWHKDTWKEDVENEA